MMNSRGIEYIDYFRNSFFLKTEQFGNDIAQILQSDHFRPRVRGGVHSSHYHSPTVSAGTPADHHRFSSYRDILWPVSLKPDPRTGHTEAHFYQ